ncbi:MAG: nicotinate-nucleotide adenylyltransferase [Syntrophomonadaceae bacterium]
MEHKSALGIIGGTFNPIHNGHLLAAEYARCELGLEKVIFIPAARPPHKEGLDILDGETRLKMIELAIEGNPDFAVSRTELSRPGPSYTVDTLNFFQANYPGKSIYFIMGADSLLLFNTWKDVDVLAQKGCFVVVTRPGYRFEWEKEPLASLPRVLKENLVFLEIPGIDVSSSEIRKRVRDGKSIRYMLPDQVEGYIREKGLYTDKGA